MIQITKTMHFTVVATIVSILFWLEETLIHKYIFREEDLQLIPNDTNELWMRLLTIILLIGFGLYADYRTGKLFTAKE